MYAEYKNYLSNALETMKTDFYPKTLTEAINNASRFHRGTKSDHTPVAPVHSTFAAEEIRIPKVSFTPPQPRERPSPYTTEGLVSPSTVRLQDSRINAPPVHIHRQVQLLRSDGPQRIKMRHQAGCTQ